MTKLFQISEDDLATLEHVLPELMDWSAHSTNPVDGLLSNNVRFKKQWRDVKRIITEVRWNGPNDNVGIVPADGPIWPHDEPGNELPNSNEESP